MTDNNPTTWYSDCLLRGPIRLIADAGSVTWSVRHLDSTTPVQLHLETSANQPADGLQGVRQQLITIEFVASANDAPALADEAAHTLADQLSFVTSKPVDVEVGAVTTAPPGAIGGTYIQIGRGRLGRSRPALSELPLSTLGLALARPIPNECVGRAMRWLRRSYTTSDIVLMFTALAFGLEALVPCISIAMPDGNRDARPTSSDKLKYLATELCKVPVGAWKLVGSTRHHLFHGGMGESEDMRERLARASGWAEFVLVSGLRQLLTLSADAEPRPDRPGGSMTGVTLETEGPGEHMRLGGPRSKYDSRRSTDFI